MSGPVKPEYLAVVDPIDGSANLERGIPLCSVGVSAIPYSGQPQFAEKSWQFFQCRYGERVALV